MPAFPPSSSSTGLRPDFDFSIQPTFALPVNVRSVKRSSVASRSATAGTMWRKLTAPCGTPAAARISARRRLVRGACMGGLTTIVLPVASAGATLWAIRLSGKLNGEMPATGPRGNRRVSAK